MENENILEHDALLSQLIDITINHNINEELDRIDLDDALQRATELAESTYQRICEISVGYNIKKDIIIDKFEEIYTNLKNK